MATEAVALQLSRRRDDQPRPAGKETKAAQGSDKTEPVRRLPDQRHDIQAPAKKENPGQQHPPCAAIDGAVKREHQQRDRVNEVIEDRLVLDIQHAAHFET